MKNYIKALSLAAILAFGSGCSDDFGDMNTPIDAIDKPDPAYLFSNMTQGWFENYQRNVNLYPDLYSQYWSNIVSGFESGRYEYVDGWIGNLWKEFYTDHLTESIAITDYYGDNELYTDVCAMSELYICAYWQRMTDTYGDMPYFGAGQGESVPYNTQQEIYYDLFERVSAAVDAISGDVSQVNIKDYDRIYGGDTDKWKRFGNTLRLRLAMRISNVDPAKAELEAKAALAHEAGLLASNDDVAKVGQWTGGWFDYLDKMAWSWNNIRMSKTMSDLLYDQSTYGEDPRTPIWFAYQIDENSKSVPVTKEEVGQNRYLGIENGFNTIDDNARYDYATMNVSGVYQDWVEYDSDGKVVAKTGDHATFVPIMFYSEALFLKAEAAIRGWVAEDVNSVYEEAILASMEYVGVDASDATDYIAGLPKITGSNESSLKQLITQKWVATFPNGIEAWADFRRTDYPDVTLPVDGVSGNSTVASGTWVKRIRYPDNQFNTNSANVPYDSYLDNRMDEKLWWDTADTKAKANGLANSNL